MKAIGLYEHLPIDDERSLLDLELPRPEPAGRDLLVAVRAVSVNPVDTKVRARQGPPEKEPLVLGWDAAGEVVAVGPEVEHYAVGDAVWYAGDITRPGSNSEFQLVDERIVGRKPAALSFEEAAALPLTAITAWEALFDRLGISREGADAGKSILVIAGAGGVGSIATQLANRVAGLEVIATASREESRNWCLEHGAKRVVDHRSPLHEELAAIGIPNVDCILCLAGSGRHWPAMVEAIRPQGNICAIVDAEGVDLSMLKSKSAGFLWEFMFTRSMFQTPDMIEQQRLLNGIADLVDAGQIVSTLTRVLEPIDAENLRQAHAIIEQGHTTGKIVLSGWD